MATTNGIRRIIGATLLLVPGGPFVYTNNKNCSWCRHEDVLILDGVCKKSMATETISVNNWRLGPQTGHSLLKRS